MINCSKNRKSIISFGTFIGLILTLSSCAVHEDYSRARQRDTVKSYERFIKSHPDSERAKWARDRIEELKTEKKLAKEREERRKRTLIDAMRDEAEIVIQYETGNLTEDQFFEDGWNAKKPFSYDLGIIGATRTDESLKITMGTYSWGKAPRNFELGFTEDGRRRSFVNFSTSDTERMSKLYQSYFEKYHKANNFSWEPKESSSLILGVLIFKKNILVSKSISNLLNE